MVGSTIGRNYTINIPLGRNKFLQVSGLGRTVSACYDRVMSRWAVFAFLLFLVTAAPAAAAPDQLSDAQRLYNAGQYDAAERAAREAARNPASLNAARVVLGRIQLERYRRSAAAADLASARESFSSVDARALDRRDRVELSIGLGEALYLEDRFGAAADLFESVLATSAELGPAAHERVLDWWASALDRVAQSRPTADRPAVYDRIIERMTAEVADDPGSTAAGYWMAAAARGRGDLDRAWNAAAAAWVRAPFGHDRGAALRADLDRLMVQAVIPERASRLPLRDHRQAVAGMLAEWEAFKTSWSR
jgi:tetratricopeptide (TPR) repeat protein